MDHPAGGWVAVGWDLQPLRVAWPVGSQAQYQRGQRRDKVLQVVHASPRGLSGGLSQRVNQAGQERTRAGEKRIGLSPALTAEQVEQCLRMAE